MLFSGRLRSCKWLALLAMLGVWLLLFFRGENAQLGEYLVVGPIAGIFVGAIAALAIVVWDLVLVVPRGMYRTLTNASYLPPTTPATAIQAISAPHPLWRAKVLPWHAVIVVALLMFMGQDYDISSPERFAFFLRGTALLGGFFALVVWLLNRRGAVALKVTSTGAGMNNQQQLVVKWVLGLVGAALLFPPFHVRLPNGAISNLGYAFLFEPPKWGQLTGSVDVGMLVVEWLAIALIGAAFWWLARGRAS